MRTAINFPVAYDVSDPDLTKKISLGSLREWNQRPSNLFLLESNILILLLIISFVATLLLSSKKNYELKLLLLMDYLSILILNYFLNPILAFTIYFCFLHSIRHSLSLIFQLNRSFNKGFKAFIKKAMPLTIVTAIIYLFSLLSI